MSKASPTGRRAGSKETLNDWVPHKGPYKVIKLPRDAGVVPEMTEANLKKEDW